MIRWLWHLLGTALFLLGLGVTALTIAGLFGEYSWRLDLASAFRAQYAVLLTVATITLSLLRRRVAALVLGLAALVNIFLVAPLWLSSPAPAEGDATLEVLYHNVHTGGTERFEAVAEVLRESNADLVFLAGGSFRWRTLIEQSDLPYTVIDGVAGADHRRIMALSRIPIASAEQVPLIEGARSGAIAVEILLGDRPVKVLGLHTYSPRTALTSALRDAELSAVAGWVTAETVPVVMVGDLNATPWSHAYRSLVRETDLRNSQHGFGLQPSWPAGVGPLMIPIDHILHDRNLTTIDRRTGPALGSPHRSVSAVFGWSTGDP